MYFSLIDGTNNKALISKKLLNIEEFRDFLNKSGYELKGNYITFDDSTPKRKISKVCRKCKKLFDVRPERDSSVRCLYCKTKYTASQGKLISSFGVLF